MRIVHTTAIALMLTILGIPWPALAEERGRLPKSPDELSIALTVNEAFEEGPIECTVTLKNLSKDTLQFYAWNTGNGGWCQLDSTWKPRKEPVIRSFVLIGNPGPYLRDLAPGETASETIYLQNRFLSILPGKVTARFGWHLCKPADKQEKDAFRVDLDKLFDLESKQEIEIRPATEKNLMLVQRNFEAELAKILDLEKQNPGAANCVGGAWDQWAMTIEGCRHKEFVPLLFRAIDQMPSGYHKFRLIDTVCESFATPKDSFAAMAEYLSSHRPASAADFLWCWVNEEREHKRSKERQEKLKKPLEKAPDKEKDLVNSYSREMTKLEEEAWQSSKRHMDTRLTKQQFAQLLAIKDVWVRALVYAHFPDQCPAEWVAALFKDLKQLVQAPEGFTELIAKLDHDDFKIREKATKELIELCRRFNWQLRDVRDDILSLEAKERLKRVRESVEKSTMPILWERTISHLAWNAEPQNQKMLDILRTSNCRNSISEAAQEAFEARNKRDKEISAAMAEYEKREKQKSKK